MQQHVAFWFGTMMLLLLAKTESVASQHQRVRVNFFRSPKGKWISFLNLRASFPDVDAVEVDLKTPSNSLDFDQLDETDLSKNGNDDRVTTIYITPFPLLQTIDAPTTPRAVSTTLPTGNADATTSLRAPPSPSFDAGTTETPPELHFRTFEEASPSTTEATVTSDKITTPHAPTEAAGVDYALNDLIPGIFDLGTLVIPHRLRHSGHRKTTVPRLPETTLASRPPVTESSLAVTETSAWTGATGSMPRDDEAPIDDEDYYAGSGFVTNAYSWESSTSESVSEEPVTKEPETTADTEAMITPTTAVTSDVPSSSVDPVDALLSQDYSFGADYFYESFNDTSNDTDVGGSIFFNSANATEEEVFVLTAREVLHEDPLGRNETVLRDLLSNLTYLDVEEDFGSYHRDHGASFLIPVLKAVHYDNSSVPIVFSDIPLNVKVKLSIIHLANFDSVEMEYTIDLEMEMRWFDVRLANNYTKPIRVREKEILDQVFRPDPYFVNSKYSYFHTVSFPNFRMRILPTGLIIYTLRVTLQPSCSMTFCRFPHDTQVCDLLLSSIAYPKSFVNLIWHAEPINFLSQISLPELRIKKLTTEECVVEGKLIASSCLRLVFNLERDGARYIVEKYVPSTLAMMFAWVAPYVPYNYEDVRIITPITVLLTLVQMEKGDLQVRTSYLTSMDTWFGAMKAFSVISLIESLIVLALIKRSRAMEKQAHRATNQYARELFETEKRRLTDLYHRLDTASRFLSPVVFIMFFIYYVLYIAQGDEKYCLSQNVL